MLHRFDFYAGSKADLREGDRLPIRFTAMMDDGSGKLEQVGVLNISRLGFMAECAVPLRIGSVATFTAPNGETFTAQIRWALAGRIGCRFQQELGWEDVLGLGLEELDSEELPEPGSSACGA